jgi:hypothetical protein
MLAKKTLLLTVEPILEAAAGREHGAVNLVGREHAVQHEVEQVVGQHPA